MTTFRSDTELSINVRLDGHRLHLRFIPTTMGESFYTTDDPRLLHAIEQHRYYGTLFTKVEAPPTPTAPPRHDDGDDGLVHMPFTDLADAKEQLAQRLGISRTTMRTPQDILVVARRHGIALDGFPESYSSLSTPRS